MQFFETEKEAKEEIERLNREDKTHVHSFFKLNKNHPSGKKYQTVSLSQRVLKTLEKM